MPEDDKFNAHPGADQGEQAIAEKGFGVEGRVEQDDVELPFFNWR